MLSGKGVSAKIPCVLFATSVFACTTAARIRRKILPSRRRSRSAISLVFWTVIRNSPGKTSRRSTPRCKDQPRSRLPVSCAFFFFFRSISSLLFSLRSLTEVLRSPSIAVPQGPMLAFDWNSHFRDPCFFPFVTQNKQLPEVYFVLSSSMPSTCIDGHCIETE